jgi:hypothetical protein
MMHDNATYKCDQPFNPFECPDYLIYHHKQDGFYGIIVHDGGESSVEIRFCPWCGTNLKVN